MLVMETASSKKSENPDTVIMLKSEMAEKLEDLNLPLSVISRLIRDALPEGTIVSREARTAIARAASVFVLYLTSSSNNVAIKSKRKTISGDDVFQAVVDTEFEMFEEPLREAFDEFKRSQKMKKDAAAKKRLSKESKKTTEEDIMEVKADEDIENDAEEGD